MVTSNVDAYYPLLAQQMDQGYRLLTFYHIPGEVKICMSLNIRRTAMGGIAETLLVTDCRVSRRCMKQTVIVIIYVIFHRKKKTLTSAK